MITNSTLGISDDDFSSRNKTGLVLLLPTTIFPGNLRALLIWLVLQPAMDLPV